ncbi:hypothetical protein ACFLZP_03805 [Patescibacteria group bacterium]
MSEDKNGQQTDQPATAGETGSGNLKDALPPKTQDRLERLKGGLKTLAEEDLRRADWVSRGGVSIGDKTYPAEKYPAPPGQGEAYYALDRQAEEVVNRTFARLAATARDDPEYIRIIEADRSAVHQAVIRQTSGISSKDIDPATGRPFKPLPIPSGSEKKAQMLIDELNLTPVEASHIVNLSKEAQAILEKEAHLRGDHLSAQVAQKETAQVFKEAATWLRYAPRNGQAWQDLGLLFGFPPEMMKQIPFSSERSQVITLRARYRLLTGKNKTPQEALKAAFREYAAQEMGAKIVYIDGQPTITSISDNSGIIPK